MRKLSVKVKKSLAFIMAASLFVQSAGFTKSACADEVPQDYSGLVWTDQSTDEILNMVDKGLELETFFEGDLTKGTTKEELLEWKSQGKDIKEVVLERARERSKTITMNHTHMIQEKQMRLVVILRNTGHRDTYRHRHLHQMENIILQNAICPEIKVM